MTFERLPEKRRAREGRSVAAHASAETPPVPRRDFSLALGRGCVELGAKLAP